MTNDIEILAQKIAIAGFRSMNAGLYRRLSDAGISLHSFFELSAANLLRLVPNQNGWQELDIRKKSLDSATDEAHRIANLGINITECTDPSYPRRLLACEDAPAILYSVGDIKPQAKHIVSIVGTRHSTPYGIDFTQRLVEDLGSQLDDLLIVSGLAYGIDIAAHRAALNADICTGAVLAHGLNTIYPSDHRNDARAMIENGGFVISEYRTDAPVHRANFLSRNRIIAGLADVTIVVESDVKGGSLSTARNALSYNRTVAALPGRLTDKSSRGCNALIAKGDARLIRDAEDLISIMNWESTPQASRQKEMVFLSPEQTTIVDYLHEHPDTTANDLCVALNIDYGTLSAMLIELEILDQVIALPGGRYSAVENVR